jgi:hypothetical protein
MKLNPLIATVALLFTAFIQTGCGSANPNLYGYSQFQGVCPFGNTYQNGLCMPGNGSNGSTADSACSSGSVTYMGAYGCPVGYVGQGSTCVCQTSQQGQTAGFTTQQGSAQCKSGYFAVMGVAGCYQQSNCPNGFALTPSWGTQSFYNNLSGGYCSRVLN